MQTDEQLSEHFTLSELVHSDLAVRKGLDNTPSAEALMNMRHHLVPGLERVRALLNELHEENGGAPGRISVHVNSGYRGPAVNRAAGGSNSSQHMLGLAADITAARFGTPRQICEVLVKHKPRIQFDQLIWEGGWVHISFAAVPRGSILTAHFEGGSVRYTTGLA